MTKEIINKHVNVTAVYFNNPTAMETYPRRIEFEGRTYTFADGIRYLVKKGGTITQLFDMSDGSANFRLRQDGKHADWTLLAITR